MANAREVIDTLKDPDHCIIKKKMNTKLAKNNALSPTVSRLYPPVAITCVRESYT